MNKVSFSSYTHTLFFGGGQQMSSASFYDWEKSLQSNRTSQFTISPSPIKQKNSIKEKSKGTIDYFMDKNTGSTSDQPPENRIEELDDIGDIIFRKIIRLWKLKNL